MSDHTSVAEAVLAEVQAMTAPEADGAAPSNDTELTQPAEATEAPGEEVDFEVDGQSQSLSWNEAMRRVPPDIRNLMKNMQGDYTRKTQELAEQRKELVREREALMRGSKNIVAPEEMPDYDPFNEDSIKARIEAEVARRLREVLDPMEQEYNVMKAEDSYRAFLSEHPDFENDQPLRDAVQGLLEANPSLDLETAYWAAKGRRKQTEAAKAENSRAARKRAEREAAMKGSNLPARGGQRGKPSRQELRKMSAADIYRLAESMHKS
jgi:hypothetical protein